MFGSELDGGQIQPLWAAGPTVPAWQVGTGPKLNGVLTFAKSQPTT